MQHAKPKQTKHPQTVRWTCSHRGYGLDCTQFDELWQWANGRCQMCDADERRVGVLCIDHEAAVHPHAVRGLLCTECNIWLGDGRSFPDRFRQHPPAARYLERPWYRRPGAPVLRPHAPLFGRRWKEPGAKVHAVGNFLSLRPDWRASCGVDTWYLIPDSELDQELHPCSNCFHPATRIRRFDGLLDIARSRHARLQAALAYEWPEGTPR